MVVGAPQTVRATPITIQFNGVVDSVSAFFPTGQFTVGQTLSGTFTFDPTIPETIVAGTTSRYDALIDAQFVVGTYAGTFSPGSNNGIYIGSTFPDFYQVISSFAGAAILSMSPQYFGLELIDPTGTAISSSALPTLAPDLASFAQHSWSLGFAPLHGRSAILSGHLTSIRHNGAVPEPTTFALLVLGIVGVGYARRVI